jgi:actin-related protein
VFAVQYTKAGFANDNFPSVVIPAMVGTPLMRADNVAGEYELKVKHPWHGIVSVAVESSQGGHS